MPAILFRFFSPEGKRSLEMCRLSKVLVSLCGYTERTAQEEAKRYYYSERAAAAAARNDGHEEPSSSSDNVQKSLLEISKIVKLFVAGIPLDFLDRELSLEALVRNRGQLSIVETAAECVRLGEFSAQKQREKRRKNIGEKKIGINKEKRTKKMSKGRDMENVGKTTDAIRLFDVLVSCLEKVYKLDEEDIRGLEKEMRGLWETDTEKQLKEGRSTGDEDKEEGGSVAAMNGSSSSSLQVAVSMEEDDYVKKGQRMLKTTFLSGLPSHHCFLLLLSVRQLLIQSISGPDLDKPPRLEIDSPSSPYPSQKWKGLKVVPLDGYDDKASKEEIENFKETMAVCYISQVDNIEYTHPLVRKTGLITHSGVLVETRDQGKIIHQTVVDLVEVEAKPWCAVRHYRQKDHNEVWNDSEQVITYYRTISFNEGKKPWRITMTNGNQAPVRFAVWRGSEEAKKIEEIHNKWVLNTKDSMFEMTKGQFKHITGNCQHAAAYAVNNIKLKAEETVPGLGETPSAKPPNVIFRMFTGTRSWRPELGKDFSRRSRGSKSPSTPKLSRKMRRSTKGSMVRPRSPHAFESSAPLPLPVSKIPELLASLTAKDTGLDIRDRKRRMHLGKHKQCFKGNGFCDWMLSSGWATDRTHGLVIGEFLRELGLIEEVHPEHQSKPFEDSSGRFYRFVKDGD